ncbi:hypothetical protein ACH4OW_25740 [Streptomyces sp. NPDC017056]|uniref:hypothetical protein n=1 Tax=Streptomyces sp. NPDC017056 TaxID=3364973 RepID=UPI003789D9C0
MSKQIQAITAVMEGRLWKHLALSGSEYVIFTDKGINEGPGLIATKWRFLPARFTSDLDAASVVMEGGIWKYMFIKGNERIVFTDSAIFAGPEQVAVAWPFLRNWLGR